jgi:predicted transposase YdaD
MNTEEYIKMEAMEEGLAKGLKKGRREGRLEGKLEGKREATRSFVEYLLKDSDFPLEKIATSCKVSLDYVNNIKEKMIVL